MTASSSNRPATSTRGHSYWDALERAAHSEGMLSREREHLLAVRAKQGDQQAFDRLVRSHIPLVFSIAFELRDLGLSPEELASEGLLGLVKGARDFDPDRGTRFATYASFWIRAHMRSYWQNNRRIVRGPCTRNARKLRGSMRRVEREIEQKTGEAAAPEAVADALKVPTCDVEEMRCVLSARDVACGTPVADGGVDVAANGPTPEALSIEADERRHAATRLRWAMSRLPARARRVLSGRYLTDHERTLADMGRELGLSRERVRQIEVQAMQDVRAALASRSEIHGTAAPALMHAS